MTHGCKRSGGFVDSGCNALCDCHETMKLPKYFTIRPGNYVRFEIPNRLYGAAINAEGDAI